MISSAKHLDRTATSLLNRWKNDPARFAREALGVKLAPAQEQILDAVAHHKYTAVRSGQKTGKSTACAIVAHWWVQTRYRGYVVMTAPSFPQVKDPLWKEVRRLWKESKVPLGGDMLVDPTSGWTLPGDRRVFCRTTDSAERMQGTSSPNMLYIVDEASGYPVDLWEPLLGNMAGGGKLLATSNPTKTVGDFFDAFASPKESAHCEHCGVEHGLWKTVHLRSDDTPNYHARRKLIPGLAEYEWVEERRKAWGELSAAYQVRVLGNFPTQADNAVVPMGLVNQATARENVNESGVLNIGVDVARFGDDETVIRPRRGLKALEQIAINGFDNVDVAGEVLKLSRRLRRSDQEIPHVKIDTIGNGGGVYDVLRRSKEIRCTAVNVAENATAEGYHRLRDQIWFAIRDWLEQGGSIEDDPKLTSELVAPVYDFDAQGRIRVESKDAIKSKLGRSPDRADALALSVYEPPARAATYDPRYSAGLSLRRI